MNFVLSSDWSEAMITTATPQDSCGPPRPEAWPHTPTSKRRCATTRARQPIRSSGFDRPTNWRLETSNRGRLSPKCPQTPNPPSGPEAGTVVRFAHRMTWENWPRRIRTFTNRSRVCCATVTLGANGSVELIAPGPGGQARRLGVLQALGAYHNGGSFRTYHVGHP